jgi:hypothetical protein
MLRPLDGTVTPGCSIRLDEMRLNIEDEFVARDRARRCRLERRFGGQLEASAARRARFVAAPQTLVRKRLRLSPSRRAFSVRRSDARVLAYSIVLPTGTGAYSPLLAESSLIGSLGSSAIEFLLT